MTSKPQTVNLKENKNYNTHNFSTLINNDNNLFIDQSLDIDYKEKYLNLLNMLYKKCIGEQNLNKHLNDALNDRTQVDTVIFPDNYSTDISCVPEQIKKLFLGKDFSGCINEELLPLNLQVIYPDKHPRVEKKNPERNVEYFYLNPENESEKLNLYDLSSNIVHSNVYIIQDIKLQLNNSLSSFLKKETISKHYSEGKSDAKSNRFASENNNKTVDNTNKYLISQYLSANGINTEYDNNKKKLTVEIHHLNEQDFNFKINILLSYIDSVDKLILTDNFKMIKQLPADFYFGNNLTSIVIFLPAFDSQLPEFPESCRKIILNVNEMRAAVPKLPTNLQVFKFYSKTHNVSLPDFPFYMRKLHLNLKYFNKKIPEYPTYLQELSLELAEYKQDYPILPPYLSKYYLRNLYEKTHKRNLDIYGNETVASGKLTSEYTIPNLENFAEHIAFFPEALETLELPIFYKYPLPEELLDRISNATQLRNVNIYGTANKEIIVSQSQNKLALVVAEIAEDERKLVGLGLQFGQAHKNLFIRYKTILEMYKNIQVTLEKFSIHVTKDLNYFSTNLFSFLYQLNLSYNYPGFNLQIPSFDNLCELSVASRFFNQNIPGFKNLTVLNIDSPGFSHEIPYMEKLESLNVNSVVFNHEIPHFPKLSVLRLDCPSFNNLIPHFEFLRELSVESSVFNRGISKFDQLQKLLVRSPKFAHPIPYLKNLVEFTIESCLFNHEIPHFELLQKFIIRSKIFNRCIPAFTDLNVCEINSHKFNQEIPYINTLKELTIVNTSHLYDVNAECNSFNSPIPIFNELVKLHIESIAFNQEIPHFEKLTHLHVHACGKFNYPIPHFRQLQKLYINSIQFNQPIPHMEMLKELYIKSGVSKFDFETEDYLDENTFNHPIPHFKKLTQLYINSKAFNQDIPKFEFLKVLEIHSPLFEYPIPNMVSLCKLNIVSELYNHEMNDFVGLIDLQIKSDVFNQDIPKYKELETLRVKSYVFDSPLPHFDKLKKLRITSPVFNQEIPVMLSLNELKIKSNVFNKQVPFIKGLKFIDIQSQVFNQESIF